MEILSNSYFILFVVGVVVLYFIFFKIIPFIKDVKKKMGKIYLNPSANLSSEEYKKVSIGAIYSEQQTAFINSLETGLPKDKISTITQDWWSITDRKTAIETLDYLQNKGHRYYFNVVYKAFQTKEEEAQKNILIENLVPNGDLSDGKRQEVQEDISKAYDQLKNLEENINELIQNGVIKNTEDMIHLGVLGWDVCRLNFVTRLCYESGYINTDEAWFYINSAYDTAQKHFGSWKDLAYSYVLGRAMWGGSYNSGIKHIADYLLTDPKSPWVEFKWK